MRTNPERDMTLANKVRAARYKMAVSKSEFARIVGVSKRVMHDAITGQNDAACREILGLLALKPDLGPSTVTFRAGTVIHVCGLPFTLRSDTRCSGQMHDAIQSLVTTPEEIEDSAADRIAYRQSVKAERRNLHRQ